jgi:hypothetical protein
MGGQLWSREEKELVIHSKTKNEFAMSYIGKFGAPDKLSRIDNLWKARKEIRMELVPQEIIAVSQKSQVLKPSAIVVDDVTMYLNSISDKLSQLIQLQKEQIEFFKKLEKKPKEGENGGQGSGEGNG